GDVMLDTYWWGTVDRISPEGPVPVVAVTKKEHRIGGAGNVALNLQALGSNAALISVLGKDEEGEKLRSLLEANNINCEHLLFSGDRITTNKIRIIGRNQQMMRLDAEHAHDLNNKEEDGLVKKVEKYISTEKPDIIILQDYNKGVLTKKIITKVIDLCNANKIICAADPKRKNFFAYKNITLFKPNLKEVKDSLHILNDEINEKALSAIHLQLKEKLDHSISLITLSEKGMFYQNEKVSKIIPSHLRNVADVSGAGDTVIAIASLVYAATKNIQLTAEIANIAGGLVCEVVGTAAIDKQNLVEECKLLLT
ncbi:MAG TPA: bifunctional ADP-heptose synthase, partial [Chitinophagaceae bacterium]|nr:bifunctional ADP-heptose synthase [Chitinophagaceae bacterium]